MNTATKKYPDFFDKYLNVLLKISIAILGIITFSFLLMPFVVLSLVNKKLRNMPDFGGKIKSMRLNLFDASITIKGISLAKKNMQIPVMFFSLDHMSISLRIFKRRLLADISVDNFNINLVKGIKEDDSQLGLDKAWIEFAKQLFFLNISRLQIENGSTHFRTYHTVPPVDICVDNIKLVAEDLNIRSTPTDLLPANVHLSALVHGGILKLDGTMNPRNPVPTFDVNAELHGLNLAEINSLLLAYADIDVKYSIRSNIRYNSQDIFIKTWIEKHSGIKTIFSYEFYVDGEVVILATSSHNILGTDSDRAIRIDRNLPKWDQILKDVVGNEYTE